MGIFSTFNAFFPLLTICPRESIFKVLIKQSIIHGVIIMKSFKFPMTIALLIALGVILSLCFACGDDDDDDDDGDDDVGPTECAYIIGDVYDICGGTLNETYRDEMLIACNDGTGFDWGCAWDCDHAFETDCQVLLDCVATCS